MAKRGMMTRAYLFTVRAMRRNLRPAAASGFDYGTVEQLAARTVGSQSSDRIEGVTVLDAGRFGKINYGAGWRPSCRLTQDAFDDDDRNTLERTHGT